MDTSSSAFRLLSLIALSGECGTEFLSYMGISESYGEKLITKLKDDNYIKSHYRDRLRGYRLTNRGKKLLLEINPDRFGFYLSGNSDTNRPRSDVPRRMRLQQTSIVYATLLNAGVTIFRDEKPLLFQPGNQKHCSLPLPVFYQSREIKELGADAIKINNSRTIGVLFAEECIYAVFYTGDSLMRWEYRTELKVKTMIQYHITRGILSKEYITPWYHPDTPVKAMLIGKDMGTALKLLTSTGGFQKSYFYLDTSFDYFHYLPSTPAGETLLKLLCSPKLRSDLRTLLLSDLHPPCPDYGLEHDATLDGIPVLLGFDFDMLRLSRYRTALSLQGLSGHLICFDFQKEVLAQFFGDLVTIETIDLEKFERRFLH